MRGRWVETRHRGTPEVECSGGCGAVLFDPVSVFVPPPWADDVQRLCPPCWERYQAHGTGDAALDWLRPPDEVDRADYHDGAWTMSGWSGLPRFRVCEVIHEAAA